MYMYFTCSNHMIGRTYHVTQRMLQILTLSKFKVIVSTFISIRLCIIQTPSRITLSFSKCLLMRLFALSVSRFIEALW